MVSLTATQRRLWFFIASYMDKKGVAPSYDEMAAGMDLRSKSGIVRLVRGLEERGYLKRMPHRERALELLRMPNAHPALVILPEDLMAQVSRYAEKDGRTVDAIVEAAVRHTFSEWDAMASMEQPR